MLEWIFLPHTFSKTVTTLLDVIVRLVSRGQKLYQILCVFFFPSYSHIPLPADAFQDMFQESLSLQAAMTDFLGKHC